MWCSDKKVMRENQNHLRRVSQERCTQNTTKNNTTAHRTFPTLPAKNSFHSSFSSNAAANQQHGRRSRRQRAPRRILLCLNTGSSSELSALASKCSRSIWVSSLSRWSQPSNFQCCLQLSSSRALLLCILATLQGDDGDCNGHVVGTRGYLLRK